MRLLGLLSFANAELCETDTFEMWSIDSLKIRLDKCKLNLTVIHEKSGMRLLRSLENQQVCDIILEILDSYAAGSVEHLAAKNLIWSYELFPVMLLALKQDFNKVLDGWNAAAKLSNILAYDFLLNVI